jgi:hypothetical protein
MVLALGGVGAQCAGLGGQRKLLTTCLEHELPFIFTGSRPVHRILSQKKARWLSPTYYPQALRRQLYSKIRPIRHGSGKRAQEGMVKWKIGAFSFLSGKRGKP